MATCTACGVQLESGARFCGECGGRQALPAAPGRQINVAGGDIHQTVIVEGARDRARDLNEYKNTYRGILGGLQVARRAWLTNDEQRLLDDAAARLLINGWERETCERDVQSFLGIVVTARPTELWSIGGGGRQLAQNKDRREAVENLADYLDEFAPDKLLVWRKDFGGQWHALAAEPDLLSEVLTKRKQRYLELLSRLVRENRISNSAELLDRAARHLSHQDAQEIRRTVEQAIGRAIVLPRSGAVDAAPARSNRPGQTPAGHQSPLPGTYEAENNPSVRLEIGDGVLQLKSTYPYARSGRATIAAMKISGNDFALTLSGHVGAFSSLRGIEGTLTANGLAIRKLDTHVPKEFEPFQTKYIRL